MDRSPRRNKKKEERREMIELVEGQRLQTRHGSKEEKVIISDKQLHREHRQEVYMLHEKVYEMDLFRQHFYEHNKKFIKTIQKDFQSIDAFQTIQQIQKPMDLISERYTEVEDYVKCQELDVKTAIKTLRNIWTRNKQIHSEEIAHLGRLFQVLSKFEYLRSKYIKQEEEHEKSKSTNTEDLKDGANFIKDADSSNREMDLMRNKYIEANQRFDILCEYVSMQDALILECLDLVEEAPDFIGQKPSNLTPRIAKPSDAPENESQGGSGKREVTSRTHKKSVVKFNLDSNDESPHKSRDNGMNQSRSMSTTSPTHSPMTPVKSNHRLKRLSSGIHHQKQVSKALGSQPKPTESLQNHQDHSRDFESVSSKSRNTQSKILRGSARRFTNAIPQSLIYSRSTHHGVPPSSSSKIPVRISTSAGGDTAAISPRNSAPICRPLSSPALEFHQIHAKNFIKGEIPPAQFTADLLTDNIIVDDGQTKENYEHNISYIPFLPIFKGTRKSEEKQQQGVTKLKPLNHHQTKHQAHSRAIDQTKQPNSEVSIEDNETHLDSKKILTRKIPRYESISSTGYGSMGPKQKLVLPKIYQVGDTANCQGPTVDDTNIQPNHLAPIRGILKQSKIHKDVLRLADPTIRLRRAATVSRQVIQPTIVSMAPSAYTCVSTKQLDKLPQIPHQYKGVSALSKIPHPPSVAKANREVALTQRRSRKRVPTTLRPLQPSNIARVPSRPLGRPNGFQPHSQFDAQRFGALQDGFQHNVTYFHNPRNFQ